MSVLDGVSLVLATGLFIYLLVALLRADRRVDQRFGAAAPEPHLAQRKARGGRFGDSQ